MHSGMSIRLQSVCFITIVLFACTASFVSPASGAEQTAGAAIAEEEYPKIINVREAAEKRENGAFILDVRGTDEWNVAHIPESILIPLDQLRDRLDEIPKDRDIVVVCQSGGRSKAALDFIRTKGFLKSSSMQGGIQLWRQVGYPIEKGE